MRIFRPLKSSTFSIGFLNQPVICTPVLPHRHRHHVEGRVDLVPQLDAAAVVEPAVHALEVEAERHGGEVLRGEGLAGPEVAVGVVHLDGALRHGVEAFERRDQLAGGEMLDLEPALRHGVDHLDEVGRAAGALHVEGRAGAIGVGHLPAERLGWALTIAGAAKAPPAMPITPALMKERRFILCTSSMSPLRAWAQ